MPRNILILGLTLAIVTATGIVHGLWTDRWEVSDEPRRSQARIDRVPLTIGEWDGRDMGVDFSQIPEEISGKGIVRRYVHRFSGAVVQMYLTCGRPGHISIHTPPVCYPGGGWRQEGPELPYVTAVETRGQAVECWQAKFSRSNAAGTESLRVFWAWSATGTWHAPKWPRVHFAKHHALFKLYVQDYLGKGDESPENSPSQAFLKVLIPALDKALFAEGD